MPVFRICSAADWAQTQRDGQLARTALDRRDGFIHLSTAAQVAETLARHFAGRDDLLLLTIDVGPLGDTLRFEPVPGREDAMPHVYGDVPRGAIVRAQSLVLDAAGRHALPEALHSSYTSAVDDADATPATSERAAAVLRRLRQLRATGDAAVAEVLEASLDELRTLAGGGEIGCVDALASALLDAQIHALERAEAGEAWARLDELRARSNTAGATDLVHDRYAAALYNAHRGGELLGDAGMRLAALDELRVRGRGDARALACRVALAEVLADRQAEASRRGDAASVERAAEELTALYAREPSEAIALERGRGLREQLLARLADVDATLDTLRAMAAEIDDESVRQTLAECLVIAHTQSLQTEDEATARALGDELRHMIDRGAKPASPALVLELAKLVHDGAVLGLGLASEGQPPRAAERALSELRMLVEREPANVELRALLMSALSQVHRNAIEGELDEAIEELQAEADSLLARDGTDDSTRDSTGDPRERPTGGERAASVQLGLRVDHLRMLLATHAYAGDRGEWLRAELLLTRARNLVDLAGAPLVMLEIFGQMLVNAHVDAGETARGGSVEAVGQRALALLIELRELARRHPQSIELQRHLATGLFNAHVDASRRRDRERAEALLRDLERLHEHHPGVLDLRRRLVMALVNHHGEALEREDYPHATALLERMQTLVRSSDADDHLRVQLAMALGNTLAHADDPECEQEVARIMSELRVLAAREDASETLRTLVLDELSDRFAPRQ